MVERSVALTGCLAILVGAGMLAAPGQQQGPPVAGTERPGQATRGQVWIENRGRGESIPIVAAEPLPVIVQNPVRQWEYQTLSLIVGITSIELTRTLALQGAAGWETTGVQIANGTNTLVVLKRPRRDSARQQDPPRR